MLKPGLLKPGLLKPGLLKPGLIGPGLIGPGLLKPRSLKSGLKRIGVFGGTFDPVHLAHLRSAVEMCEWVGLDEVRMIPCHIPVHRDKPGVSAEHRLNMLRLGVAGSKSLLVDTRELDRAGPSYMVDTLHSLKADYCGVQLVLSLGSDAFSGFTQWHRWQEILTLCDIIVLTRPDSDLSESAQRLLKIYQVEVIDEHLQGGQIAMHEPTPMSISSTQIRKQVGAGQELSYLIPSEVREYIDEHKLYIS